MSSKTAVDMRWHKDKRVSDENFLRHPADGKSWKDFDKEFHVGPAQFVGGPFFILKPIRATACSFLN